MSNLRPRSTTAAWLVLACVAAAAIVLGTMRDSAPATTEDRINAVAETIKCPTCQGESVADSNAPTSREIRRDIADRLGRGESPDEIRASYADNYGDAILLTPSSGGLTSLVWILPVVAAVSAIAGLVVAFRRWRGPVAHASDADRALVARALDEYEHRDRES
jgi:cytochrome c-type biogenesis protein CcmH